MNRSCPPAEAPSSVTTDLVPELSEATSPSSVVDEEHVQTRAGSSEGEKKRPTKKRKSWGQELPIPKTNLPPRKRAKTEDEKEQRRIERVLRNRAAAQSSRERKRKEVEGLEEEKEVIRRENALLAAQLRQVEMENEEWSKTVANMAAQLTVLRKMVRPDLPTSDHHHPTCSTRQVSPTLSADLLPLQGQSMVPSLKQERSSTDLDFRLSTPSQPTVDPRSASFTTPSASPRPESSITMMPDSTQHPAVMLCDLQCRSASSDPLPHPTQDDPNNNDDDDDNNNNKNRNDNNNDSRMRAMLVIWLTTTTSHLLLAMMLSNVYSRLIQPLARIFRSLRTGCPMSITTKTSVEALVPLIRWLISTPTNPLSTSSSAVNRINTTTTRTSTRPIVSPSFSLRPSNLLGRPTFRMHLLRRLLACSPALARPLREATGRALRRMSSDEFILGGVVTGGGGGGGGNGWFDGHVDVVGSTSGSGGITWTMKSLGAMYRAIRLIERSPPFIRSSSSSHRDSLRPSLRGPRASSWRSSEMTKGIRHPTGT